MGAAYFGSSLMTTGGASSKSSSTSAGSNSSAAAGNQTVGLLTLFSSFTQMQIWTAAFDHSEGASPMEQHNMTVVVLGEATLNSTQYTKVEFSQFGSIGTVIAWFNPQAGVDRVDVLGAGNHTGSQASVYAEPYLSTLSSMIALTNNSTLISLLEQTSQGTASIGPTQTVVTTYHLAAPTPPLTDVTVKFATIPGTNSRFVFYVDESTNDMMETVLQVTSLTT